MIRHPSLTYKGYGSGTHLYKKDDKKIVMYSWDESNTTVDYLIIRKQDRKSLWDAKAIPGEEDLF